MTRLLSLAAVTAAALAFASAASATTFYVSPSGSDSAAGTSSAAPWASLGKVNNASLQPGDTVLFQGGASFDGALMPAQSGSASAPITFGSYGSGLANIAGGVWFSQKSYLTFDGIKVDGGSAPGDISAVQASASGTGSTNITIRNSTFTHVRIGVNSANHDDANWTIANNLIQYTRDSGAIVIGHDLRFTGNTILDTGQDSSISYGKHGVYAKGPSLTFTGNVIRRFSANGLSLRYRNAVVKGNTISDGPIGIGWFQQDAAAGTSVIAYNTISGTSSSGIYVSASDDAGATRESFVLASNTIQGAGGNGVDLNTTSGSLTLANNVIGGGVSVAAHILSPAGAYSEHHDDFWSSLGAAQINYNGSASTLSGYQSRSAQGSADLSVNPALASDLSPLLGSPLLNAGSTSVSGVSYAAGCDGTPFNYCGTAPEIGAIESGSTVAPPPPVPVVPLAGPTALQATSTTTSVALAWTAAADPRVSGYAVTRNGTSAGTFTGTTASVAGLTCGTSYAFTVRSVAPDGTVSDPASLQASTSPCVVVTPPAPPPTTTKDTTAPWVMITAPTMGKTVPLATNVLVDATDASGIANVTFWVDGNQTCVDTTAAYSCAVSLKSGTHTLLVRATDKASNIAWMSVKVTASSSVKAAPVVSAAMRSMSTAALQPGPGAAVQKRFTLAVLKPAATIVAVTFSVDGRTVCVDRSKPFSCTTKATSGWHRSATRLATAGSARTLLTRFRVR